MSHIPDVHPRGVALIQRFESCLRRVSATRFAPYRCPANVPTVGWGTIKYPGGAPVRMDDRPINQRRCDELLAWEVDAKSRAVRRLVRVPLHPLMHAALTSFAYNCGTGALARSTLLKRVNAQRWADVPREFAKWRMGGGRVLRGLERRRTAEAALFMEGVAALNAAPALEPAPVSPAAEIVIAPTLPRRKPRLRPAGPLRWLWSLFR
ncbi:MAG: lysozyme [Pseudomonadota bacterium]